MSSALGACGAAVSVTASSQENLNHNLFGIAPNPRRPSEYARKIVPAREMYSDKRMIVRVGSLVIAPTTATACAAPAESDAWHKSPRVAYSLDFEPKVLISGPPGQPWWGSLDLTPSADFVVTKRADVVAEGVLALNRPNPSADGTLSLLGNWEWFVPITDQHERFANKRRYRGGVGYRRNRSWGLAVLYIRTNSRNTIDDPFSTSENILDVHVKRAW
jgi:hypothetical protein